jgi:hypothetical protein
VPTKPIASWQAPPLCDVTQGAWWNPLQPKQKYSMPLE